jgi:hypothetical protein
LWLLIIIIIITEAARYPQGKNKNNRVLRTCMIKALVLTVSRLRSLFLNLKKPSKKPPHNQQQLGVRTKSHFQPSKSSSTYVSTPNFQTFTPQSTVTWF